MYQKQSAAYGVSSCSHISFSTDRMLNGRFIQPSKLENTPRIFREGYGSSFQGPVKGQRLLLDSSAMGLLHYHMWVLYHTGPSGERFRAIWFTSAPLSSHTCAFRQINWFAVGSSDPRSWRTCLNSSFESTSSASRKPASRFLSLLVLRDANPYLPGHRTAGNGLMPLALTAFDL